MSGIETVIEYIVEEQQRARHIMRQRFIYQREVIVGIEYIQYGYCLFVGDGVSAESRPRRYSRPP